MNWLLLALAVLMISGLSALVAHPRSRWASVIGAGGAVAGSVLGLIPVLGMFADRSVLTWRREWAIPNGSLFLQLDTLSAFFLLPIFVLSALAAIYGAEYLAAWKGRKNLGSAWFFYNLLVASMVVVVVARNGLLFLMAWELMALASFFLVTFEDEQEKVREAGWIYLVATHLGTAFLLVLFLLMGQAAGSLDFDRWALPGVLKPEITGILFLLAVVGFGTKAGFMPFHVWLPEAHPAAPSHVSALMSGVMIKTGIYGLLRFLTLVGTPPAWWGWVLIGIGLSSGILGILFALAQHDLKRLLAYSSVENIGIITLGLGLGVLGMSMNAPQLAILGFGGSLLHILNHALFKGLLFLGAGSVLHATGSREMNRLGGLLKRMPWTGALFFLGAIALCGLPPLNGFVSEFLILFGAFLGVAQHTEPMAAAGAMVMVGLALISGLAAVAFTKSFGILFLGEPRTSQGNHAHEAKRAMLLPMILLVIGCFAMGCLPLVMLRGLAPVLATLTRYPAPVIDRSLSLAGHSVALVVGVSLFLLAVIGILVLWRSRLLAGREVSQVVTWDCGYAQPTVRMQYTASSFVQPITELFHSLLWTRRRAVLPSGLFPQTGSFATDTPDLCQGNLYRPAFLRLGQGLSKLKWLQQGRLQIYVLYIAVTLLVLLMWKLG